MIPHDGSLGSHNSKTPSSGNCCMPQFLLSTSVPTQFSLKGDFAPPANQLAMKTALRLQRTLEENPVNITTYSGLSVSNGFVINMLLFVVSLGVILSQELMALSSDSLTGVMEWVKLIDEQGCAPLCNNTNY